MKNIGNNFPWQGLIFATAFIIIGFLILSFTGLFEINSYHELYKYLMYQAMPAIFSIFFIGVGIYLWVLYIRNVFTKSKSEILYLHEIDDENICTFLNKRGKKYYYPNSGLEVTKYYKVMKTADKIDKVLGIYASTFKVPNEKNSYWLNCYLPVGNYENVFLLPILYVILLPGLISLILSPGYQKIYGAIYSVLPAFLILYDAYFKYKKRQGDSEVNTNFLDNIFCFVKLIIQIVAPIILLIMLLIFWTKTTDNFSKIALLPFILCVVCSVGMTIAKTFNNRKLVNLFNKSYVIIFLIFWFSFLTFVCYQTIRDGDKSISYFTIPFWLFGFFAIYKTFIKK